MWRSRAENRTDDVLVPLVYRLLTIARHHFSIDHYAESYEYFTNLELVLKVTSSIK